MLQIATDIIPPGLQIRDEEIDNEFEKSICEKNHLLFTKKFFRHRHALKFRVNWHHKLIAYHLERVLRGEVKNIVINVAPGSSKTELAIINFIARGLAINPRARFLHISYSDDLALLNSQEARSIVESDEFQKLWPMKIADDAKAKKRWNVVVDGQKAGGVYAVSLGGQITGFRAGHMKEGFQGAILIDDPLKVEDIYSKLKRENANRKLVSTVTSRKANPDTPTVLIMQRLGIEDPTGFIKDGNMPGQWEFVTIPALIDEAYIKSLSPELRLEIESLELVEEVPLDATGRRSYWQYKEPLAELLEREQKNRFMFSGQYQQNPTALGGNLIMGTWFAMYEHLPEIEYRIIVADTAQKTKEHNDFSVFQCWGRGTDKKIYLLDQIRGKWIAPDLKRQAIAFWAKHNAIENLGQLRTMLVEDKSSGTGLIQDLTFSKDIPVKGVERNKDKLTRLMDVLSYIETGFVCIPASAPFTIDFIAECEAFTPDDTHAHDDQVDPLIDAINELLSSLNYLSIWERQ